MSWDKEDRNAINDDSDSEGFTAGGTGNVGGQTEIGCLPLLNKKRPG